MTQRKRVAFGVVSFGLLGLVVARLIAQAPEPALTLDGELGDPFWQGLAAQRLAPSQDGAPLSLGGDVWAGLRGGYLCVAARLPEPGGKILARGLGKNPVWERDALESPPVEDLLRIRLRQGSQVVTTEINPWGGYRLEDGDGTIAGADVLRAARVSPDGWVVEAAVPLDALGLDGAAGVQVSVERMRSRRPQAPEFHWSWPAGGELARLGASLAKAEPPAVRPVELGNADPPLEAGRADRLPDMTAEWELPAWQDVPAFPLRRNEPHPRKPRHGSQIKWLHDGRTLAILARFEEPEPVEADNGGRDAALTRDDHFALYLSLDGSALLEVIVNPVGAIRDAVVRGPHARNASAGWNANIETRTAIRHGAWILRLNVPLEECARELGVAGAPRNWKILLTRLRAERPGEAAERSALPVVIAPSFYGPLRYRSLRLVDAPPSQATAPALPYAEAPNAGLAAEISRLDPDVWSPLERRYRGVRTMVERFLEQKVREAVWQERQAWDEVASLEDWERFRDERIAGLRESVGRFPPERPPLGARVTARDAGPGYRLENVIFQSRPNYWMTANLYLPDQLAGRAPGIIIVHSQHYPKTQGELHDMGELWARTGAAVLVMERPGYGERVQTTPWYRQAYGSRFLFTKQLFVAGESYSGWAAWDVIRSVDYLLDRPEIDPDRIIVLGSVAGGGEPAAVAAALDERVAAVAPFNYDQGHVRVHGDSPGQIAKQFSPWLVAASIAPRKFIRAFEFGWEGAEKADYPELWVDGFARSRKVWGFYDALDNLATSQAYGLIRLSMERVSHCFSIGPQQRVELYPTLERWFGIPQPSEQDLAILPDSQLSVNPRREQARLQELERRRPHADLLSLPPEVSAKIRRTPLHEIAREIASEDLAKARQSRRRLGADARAENLRTALAAKLGDIAPNPKPGALVERRQALSNAVVEAVSLEVESGIGVPMLLLLPNDGATAAVVGVAQGGKERFLSDRAEDVATLLEQGVAVCLPDVRATGETSPSSERVDSGAHQRLAQMESDLSRSLLGSQLKDLRTVLAYLRSRSFDRFALWGDSFSPPNPEHLYLDEIEMHSGPQIQYQAEPLGAHLALLAGLYEPDVEAIDARGGLGSYLSILESPFPYVPIDVIPFGILQAGDIADIAAALAPRALRLEALVTGGNTLTSRAEVDEEFAEVRDEYRRRDGAAAFAIGEGAGETAAWLAGVLE